MHLIGLKIWQANTSSIVLFLSLFCPLEAMREKKHTFLSDPIPKYKSTTPNICKYAFGVINIWIEHDYLNTQVVWMD